MTRLQMSEDSAPAKGRRLPEFFAVGPPRTATTWLYSVLSGHVNLPETIKEVQFFDRRYENGLAWYQRHFRHSIDGLPLGDIAPTYFYSGQARSRIASLIPAAKIICTLRDPIDRLYSLYKLKLSSGAARGSFQEALENDFEMVESARYGFHLSEWIRIFGRERVLILMHEDLVRDPQSYLGRVCQFLGIPVVKLTESKSAPKDVSEHLPAPTLPYLTHLGIRTADSLRINGYNRTMSWVRRLGLKRLFLTNRKLAVPPLDPGFKKELRARLREEVEALEALLTIDLSRWKPPSAELSALGNGSPALSRATHTSP